VTHPLGPRTTVSASHCRQSRARACRLRPSLAQFASASLWASGANSCATMEGKESCVPSVPLEHSVWAIRTTIRMLNVDSGNCLFHPAANVPSSGVMPSAANRVICVLTLSRVNRACRAREGTRATRRISTCTSSARRSASGWTIRVPRTKTVTRILSTSAPSTTPTSVPSAYSRKS
jgi:hypothetical protein